MGHDDGTAQIAVVAEQLLAPVPGGTGRYTADLLRALADSAPSGWAVASWCAWHRDVGPATVPGVRGPRRLAVPRRVLAGLWERGRGPAPRGAQVIHAPTLLVPPSEGGRLVVTIHDAVPWTHPETLTPRGVAFHRRMAARAAREAAAIVVPTAAVRDQLAAVVPGIERVEVVPPGVPRSLEPPAGAAAHAERLGLPADGFLLTVSTLEPRKGLDLLITALSRPESTRLPLVVVGPAGWGGVDPAELARRSGLPASQLIKLGRISDADLAVCYERATAVVVPSRAEGFGLPVLEAMAAGAPVVATAVPALAEVAGGAAYLVDPDPAALATGISAVVERADLRSELIKRGRRRAADFDWNLSAERLWHLYLELAGEAPTGRK